MADVADLVRLGEDGVSITWNVACDTNITGYDKTTQIIVSAWFRSTDHSPSNITLKLRWRNVTDGGSFADLVTGSGELRAGTSSGAITNGDQVSASSGCDDAVGGDEEIENESPLLSGTFSGHGKNDHIETQWCVDFSNALDGKEYEFELYNNTGGSSIGTLPATITTEAGSTTYYQSIDGTLISSGTVVRLLTAYKSLDGSLTSSGIATTASIFLQSITGALTSSGIATTTSIFLQSLAGILTSSGKVVKGMFKSLSGGFTSSGNVVKKAFASLSGSLTSSGILTSASIFFQSLSGTFTSNGVVVRILTAYKSLSGSLTSSGSVSRLLTAYRSLGGTLTSSGAITKGMFVSLVGSLSYSGVVSTGSMYLQSLSGVLISSGMISKVRTAYKSLSGSLTSIGIVTTASIFFQSLSGLLTSSGSIIKNTLLSLLGSFTSSGNLSAIEPVPDIPDYIEDMYAYDTITEDVSAYETITEDVYVHDIDTEVITN